MNNAALQESYKTIDKLNAELAILYERIRTLELDNEKRADENFRLYKIIDSKIEDKKIAEKQLSNLEERVSQMSRSHSQLQDAKSNLTDQDKT